MISPKIRAFRFLVLVTSSCILLLLFIGYWKHKARNNERGVIVQERTSTFLQIDIGSRNNLREGEIAAIQALSQRLDMEPEIVRFTIVFHSPQRYYVEYDRSTPFIQCNQQTIRLTQHRSRWGSLFDYETSHIDEPDPLYMGANINSSRSPQQIREAAHKKMSVSDIVAAE